MATGSFTDSPSWPPLRRLLDALPVFTVANEEKKPLQYEVDGQPMAIFYADVLAAKNELEAARHQHPDLNCDLIPVGLGAAYTLSCVGKASLVPSITELTAAGMPAGMPAVGQELPLFACMEMSRETEEGGTVLPLFMSFEDCEAAVKQAREADGDGSDLEIVGLSLPSVVEHLSSIADDRPTFTFVAPTRSTDHIREYVGNGVYARVVE
eukprot:CAMPEP_0119330974 /NCGR_PEP_ID=MMETSP1333-20130426/79433_1 /TAXON_ID=418940 /ORGANISM="Scyphosphaera apsteinii, Strain RCC1455" /LENGTH=209 /DNA_ID=CAMNT_0007340461 /DNA_START=94 /DNA_END=723 /DNA_ORIENTATION=+